MIPYEGRITTHEIPIEGTSLVVRWLRLQASNAGGARSTPGWGTKIPRAMRHGHKKEKKEKEIPIERMHNLNLIMRKHQVNRK